MLRRLTFVVEVEDGCSEALQEALCRDLEEVFISVVNLVGQVSYSSVELEPSRYSNPVDDSAQA